MKVKTFCVRHTPGRPPNNWCGPAAISILTGITAEEAEDRILAIRALRDGRRRPVRGTYTGEVYEVLRQLGFTLYVVQHKQGATVYQALTSLARQARDGDVFLVAAGSHWSVKERCGKRWIHTCSAVGPTSKSVYGRARVEEIYRVMVA